MDSTGYQNMAVQTQNNNPIKYKALVADDEIANQMILKKLLERYGFTVMLAENGVKAIEVFREWQPDIILMDIMMPDMDGRETTRIIKSNSLDKFIPVIMVTALTDETELAECIEAGGDDFISKPFNHILLKAKVDALLRVQKYHSMVISQRDALAAVEESRRQELELSRKFFDHVFRADYLEVPGLKYMTQPMSLFNGDVLLASQMPNGSKMFMLGDFTGHGLPAALGSMLVVDIFTAMSEKGFQINEIVFELNRKLKEALPSGHFLSACLINVNMQNSMLSVWNGGMPDVLVTGDEPTINMRFPSTKVPLGILSNDELDTAPSVMTISPGDRIYAFSDGVLEACNSDDEMFGSARVEECINSTREADLVFQNIEAELKAFCKDTSPTDDVSLIEITQQLNHDTEFFLSRKQPANNRNITSGWRVKIDLGPNILRITDPIPAMVQYVARLCGMEECNQLLYTISTELFSNALEHGLLGLQSSLKSTPDGFAEYYFLRKAGLESLEGGGISFSFQNDSDHGGNLVKIEVSDTGPGFSFDNLNQTPQDENVQYHGRGIRLLRSLCKEVNYVGNGNKVELLYEWG
jgi:CheY-like chemotaxis protein